ncbi:MAG: AAA family ATPase [Leptospirales bacterium]
MRRWPSLSGKSVRVFDRDRSGRVTFDKTFGLAGFSNVIDKVRPNASLISTLVQFDHKPSLRLREMARHILPNILIEKIEMPEPDILNNFYFQKPEMVNALNKEIERIDLGIRDMRIVSTPQGVDAQFRHDGLSDPVPMALESHGTRQFIRIFPLLSWALAIGGVAVIDELDQNIHPIVLPEIVRWFHDPQRNPHNAQLWMTCQTAPLLEELQKEEVFFCEKSSQGRTQVYGLQDIRSVRRIDNFYKKYLGGVYGAVPHIG